MACSVHSHFIPDNDVVHAFTDLDNDTGTVKANDSRVRLDHDVEIVDLPIGGVQPRRFDTDEDLTCCRLGDVVSADFPLAFGFLDEEGFLLLRNGHDNLGMLMRTAMGRICVCEGMLCRRTGTGGYIPAAYITDLHPGFSVLSDITVKLEVLLELIGTICRTAT